MNPAPSRCTVRESGRLPCRDAHRLAVVFCRLIECGRLSGACSVVLRHENDVESALFFHASEVPDTRPDGQLTCHVVPANWDHGVHSLFVCVCVPGVFVKIKTAIGASIDAQLDRSIWLFARVLDFRAER